MDPSLKWIHHLATAEGQIIEYQQYLLEAANEVYPNKPKKELKVAKMPLAFTGKWGNFGFAGHNIITNKLVHLNVADRCSKALKDGGLFYLISPFGFQVCGLYRHE